MEEKKIKVLHINCNYATTALHQTMLEHLDRQGIDSHVFVPVYDKRIATVVVKENVIVTECFRKWDRIHFKGKQKKIIESVQENYHIRDFDCLHAYTLFTDGNCAMELFKKYDIPYIVAIRSTDVNYFFKKMLPLRKLGIEIMENAAAILFLSKEYERKVFDCYVPSEKAEVLKKKSYIIPNGIDDFWIENRAVTKDEAQLSRMEKKHLKVIYAGQILKRKNIPTIQKGLKLLREKGYKVDFTVVGKIVDRKEFDKIMAQGEVRYVEPQPKEKLIEYYREHDIFVMPSHAETFGLVYAEAMSQGLPVIYSRGEGFDGQFKEGEVGFSVNPDSAQEIAEACQACVKEYAELSKNAVSRVKVFCWEAICQEYKKIYEGIVKR